MANTRDGKNIIIWDFSKLNQKTHFVRLIKLAFTDSHTPNFIGTYIDPFQSCDHH